MTAILSDDEIEYGRKLERQRAAGQWDDDAQLPFFKYLVQLQDQGITNMWGDAEFLEVAFGVDANLDNIGCIVGTHLTAREILINWIASFDLPADQQPNDGR